MVYTFDGTMDGLLTAVFDTFERHEQPEALLTAGDALPLFCDHVYPVVADEAKAQRVWAGLEKRLSRESLRLITIGWLSEMQGLNNPLYRYICKVFRQDVDAPSMEHNFADPDVLDVTNIARKVLHEQLRMKQFIRFQKAKDGTYLAVVSPDHNVLPLIVDHFADRFRNQPWLIYDAHRHYGYYYEGEGEDIPPSGSCGKHKPVRITFDDEASVPFSLADGKLRDDVMSDDDQLLQDLWRTYFKAICIRERLNPRKQLSDMPRRYWKYMTEKQ